jgi:hypothetical protein
MRLITHAGAFSMLQHIMRHLPAHAVVNGSMLRDAVSNMVANDDDVNFGVKHYTTILLYIYIYIYIHIPTFTPNI